MAAADSARHKAESDRLKALLEGQVKSFTEETAKLKAELQAKTNEVDRLNQEAKNMSSLRLFVLPETSASGSEGGSAGMNMMEAKQIIRDSR